MKLRNSLFILAAVVCSIALPARSAAQQFIDPVISVTGSVMNQLTRQPVSVNVTFLDESGQRAGSSRSNSQDGYYFITGLKAGKKYTVRLEQPNFFQTQYMVTLPNTAKYAEVSRDFIVMPMQTGLKIPFSISPFEVKKSTLRVGADEILSEVQNTLAMNPRVSIEIQTYPDGEGSKDDNLRLTQERANKLRDALVAKGIQASRISVKPSSELDPINPPPVRKAAKGKRYVGPVYFVIQSV